MGVLHAEFDDTTFADIKAAIDAETDRLFHADGGRDAAGDVRTPQQRRADAVASLEPRPRSSIAAPVSRCMRLSVLPSGPLSRPTKLRSG